MIFIVGMILRMSAKGAVCKLGAGIHPLADRVATIILQLIQAAGKTSTVLEDAFVVVGSLASGLFLSLSSIWYFYLISLYHSAQVRFRSLHYSVLALPLPGTQGTRGYPTLHSRSRDYWAYISCVGRAEHLLSWAIYDSATWEPTKRGDNDALAHALGFLMFWWYRSCCLSCVWALYWDHYGSSLASWCHRAEPCK